MSKQTMVSVREETGKRLRILRGNKKWDDIINSLIDIYLSTIEEVALTDEETRKGMYVASETMALKLRERDMLKLHVITKDGNESIKYATITNVKQFNDDGEIAAHVSFKMVEL